MPGIYDSFEKLPPIRPPVSEQQIKIEKFKARIFTIVKILAVIYILYYIVSLFFYVDLENKCFIRIVPGFLEFNNGTIIKSLRIMKKADPVEYLRTCKEVKVINPNVGCGGIHGGCFYVSSPDSITVNVSGNNYVFTSGMITHETCHLYQRLENRPLSEEECYGVEDKLIKNIVAH